jgi:hypothetical protein
LLLAELPTLPGMLLLLLLLLLLLFVLMTKNSQFC